MKLSYSALKMWLTCPAQFRAKYVDRTWPAEADTPALRRGREVHAVLEAAVRNGYAVPEARLGIWLPPGLIDQLHKGRAVAEAGLGITEDGRPCRPDAPDAWLIGYIDVLMAVQGDALLLDWKTGKPRPDPLQADVYATLLRAHDPQLAVQFVWVFLEARVVESIDVDMNAERRVRSIAAQALAPQEYEPKPSFACAWCPLVACQHNRSRG